MSNLHSNTIPAASSFAAVHAQVMAFAEAAYKVRLTSSALLRAASLVEMVQSGRGDLLSVARAQYGERRVSHYLGYKVAKAYLASIAQQAGAAEAELERQSIYEITPTYSEDHMGRRRADLRAAQSIAFDKLFRIGLGYVAADGLCRAAATSPAGCS